MSRCHRRSARPSPEPPVHRTAAVAFETLTGPDTATTPSATSSAGCRVAVGDGRVGGGVTGAALAVNRAGRMWRCCRAPRSRHRMRHPRSCSHPNRCTGRCRSRPARPRCWPRPAPAPATGGPRRRRPAVRPGHLGRGIANLGSGLDRAVTGRGVAVGGAAGLPHRRRSTRDRRGAGHLPGGRRGGLAGAARGVAAVHAGARRAGHGHITIGQLTGRTASLPDRRAFQARCSSTGLSSSVPLCASHAPPVASHDAEPVLVCAAPARTPLAVPTGRGRARAGALAPRPWRRCRPRCRRPRRRPGNRCAPRNRRR